MAAMEGPVSAALAALAVSVQVRAHAPRPCRPAQFGPHVHQIKSNHVHDEGEPYC